MIRPPEGRVIAMVRTEQEEIVFPEKREKLPELCIESLDLPRVALRSLLCP